MNGVSSPRLGGRNAGRWRRGVGHGLGTRMAIDWGLAPRARRRALHGRDQCPGAHRPALHVAALWLCAAYPCRRQAAGADRFDARVVWTKRLPRPRAPERLCRLRAQHRSGIELPHRAVARPEPRPRSDPRFLQRPGAGGAMRPALDAAVSRLDVHAPRPARAARHHRRGIAHRMRLLRRAELHDLRCWPAPCCAPCARRCSPQCSASAPISP